MAYQRGSLRDQRRRKMLMALEEKFQLGTGLSTLSSLIILASSAGRPQENWIKSLLRFLCTEGYLSKTADGGSWKDMGSK